MATISVYDQDGQIMDSVDLSEQKPYNDPACKHEHVVTVEDNSGIENVVAKRCNDCHVGWLMRTS